ncbi:MAG: LysR family transcriptional regulator [Pseudomonadota bacterium]
MQSAVPNLTALRAFEAAARLESFVGAAHELGVTPAAVSRAIARLEHDIGFALFHRAHRSVSLTPAGRHYAQSTAEAFRHLSVTPVHDPTQHPHLTLDVEATFLRQWLLPRLRDDTFVDLDLTLTIRPHDDPPRVIPSGADLAVVWGFADYTGFKRTRLVSPRTILVAAPSLAVTRLAEVARAGLIHEANDHWWRLIYQEAASPYPEHARTLTLGRCDLPIEAARLGLGVAVADDVIAEQELRSGALTPVDGPRLDGQDYFMMTRKTPSVPARRMASWLMGQAAEFAAWQRDLPGHA